LHKAHHFRGDERLTLLVNTLFEVAAAYGWSLQAWAVFSNHYHFIAQSPAESTTLKPMIQRLHSQTARLANRTDGAEGRQVWFQYWDRGCGKTKANWSMGCARDFWGCKSEAFTKERARS